MIILTYQDLPSHVSALVHENSDDSYTIIVNRNLSDDGKRKQYGTKSITLLEVTYLKNKMLTALRLRATTTPR